MLVFGDFGLLYVIVFNRVIVQPVKRFCGRSRVKTFKHIDDFAGLKADGIHDFVGKFFPSVLGDDAVFDCVVHNGIEHRVGTGHFFYCVNVRFVLHVIFKLKALHKLIAHIDNVQIVKKQMRLGILQKIFDAGIDNHIICLLLYGINLLVQRGATTLT